MHTTQLTGDAKAEAKKKGADAYTSAQNAANTAKGEAYKAKYVPTVYSTWRVRS